MAKRTRPEGKLLKRAWQSVDKALRRIEEYNMGTLDREGSRSDWHPASAEQRIDYDLGLRDLHRELKARVEGK